MKKMLSAMMLIMSMSILYSCSSPEKKAEKSCSQYLISYYGSKYAFISDKTSVVSFDNEPIFNDEIYQLGKVVAMASMSYSELQNSDGSGSYIAKEQLKQCSILLEKLPQLYERLQDFTPVHNGTGVIFDYLRVTPDGPDPQRMIALMDDDLSTIKKRWIEDEVEEYDFVRDCVNSLLDMSQDDYNQLLSNLKRNKRLLGQSMDVYNTFANALSNAIANYQNY